MAESFEVPMEETELAPGVLFPMGCQTVRWRVLDIDFSAMTVLVIAEKPICERKYRDIIHQNDLRRWLNGAYLQTTFSEEERDAILETEVSHACAGSDDIPDEDTGRDRIFLPDSAEVRRYLKKKDDRAAGTAWALRTAVQPDHAIAESGSIVSNEYWLITNEPIGIRPMFRIDLRSEYFRRSIVSEEYGSVKLNIPRIYIHGNSLVHVYDDSIEELFVPDGIEKLESRCFEGLWRLKAVSLPASVKKLKENVVPGGVSVRLDGLNSMEKTAAIFAALYESGNMEWLGILPYIHWHVRGEEPEPDERERFLEKLLQRAENEKKWYIPYAAYADEERALQLMLLMEEWRECRDAGDANGPDDEYNMELIIRVRSELALNEKVPVIPAIEHIWPGVCFPFGTDGSWWRVLDVNTENMTALVIADDIIDRSAYYDPAGNSAREKITWETCTLRSWLNNDYLSKNFTKKERAAILETDISNPNNPKYRTRGGKNTTDKLFLLSVEELQKYLPKKYDRTMFKGDWWWLRTPGNDHRTAAYINASGSISYTGNPVRLYDGGIRPAFRIDLNSDVFRSPRRKNSGRKHRSAAMDDSLSRALNIEMFE